MLIGTASIQEENWFANPLFGLYRTRTVNSLNDTDIFRHLNVPQEWKKSVPRSGSSRCLPKPTKPPRPLKTTIKSVSSISPSTRKPRSALPKLSLTTMWHGTSSILRTAPTGPEQTNGNSMSVSLNTSSMHTVSKDSQPLSVRIMTAYLFGELRC